MPIVSITKLNVPFSILVLFLWFHLVLFFRFFKSKLVFFFFARFLNPLQSYNTPYDT